MSMLHDLLTKALEDKASDMHVVSNLKPLFRIHTALAPVESYPVVTPQAAEALLREMIDDGMYARFQERKDLDFSTEVPGLGRFRVNAHLQSGSIGIAFRAIPKDVPALADLSLPEVVERLVDLPRGLVLVTGPTGSGKSTTLASMIDAMNHRRAAHIITIEDPIEYEFVSRKSLIEQREVGHDVESFSSGLRHALRQDPDIILLGEMRDLETVSAAITAAETGHLVLSTLHTQSAAQTIERIVDVYPAHQQEQVRSLLASTLQAVITQALFRRLDGKGMVPACEIMVCNSAVRNCIREARIHEIPNIIETNRSMGMMPLDTALKGLVFSGCISRQQALERAVRPDLLSTVLSA